MILDYHIVMYKIIKCFSFDPRVRIVTVAARRNVPTQTLVVILSPADSREKLNAPQGHAVIIAR